jgi:hypothetical protein
MSTAVKKPIKKAIIKKVEAPKKLSKVGEFMKKNRNFIEIIDMKAVMK